MSLLDLAGKRGLVVGIANASSIAYGCAKAFHAAGAELEEDVRVPGHRGRNRRDLRRLLRDAIVERQGPVEDAAGDLPAIRHLAERGRVERRGQLRCHRLHGGQNRHRRHLDAQHARKVDRVLDDVALVVEIRRDVVPTNEE